LNNYCRILMGGLLLLGLCRPGATQTFYGSTGLLVHPSAFVSAPGSFHLNVTALTQKKGPNLNTYVPTSLAYALSRRAEIGALYVRHTGPEASPHGHFGGFAKYQLVPDGASHPAFALTGTYRNGDALESFAAGVASHNFLRNGRTFLTAHERLLGLPDRHRRIHRSRVPVRAKTAAGGRNQHPFQVRAQCRQRPGPGVGRPERLARRARLREHRPQRCIPVLFWRWLPHRRSTVGGWDCRSGQSLSASGGWIAGVRTPVRMSGPRSRPG